MSALDEVNALFGSLSTQPAANNMMPAEFNKPIQSTPLQSQPQRQNNPTYNPLSSPSPSQQQQQQPAVQSQQRVVTPQTNNVNPLTQTNNQSSNPPSVRSSISSPSTPSAPSPSSSNVVPLLAPDANFSARLLHFHHCMNMDRIPRTAVHDFVFEHGCPDQKGMRSLIWKLLLQYLPFNHSEWADSLRRSRATYDKFVEELSTNPYKKLIDSGGSIGPNGRVIVNDDPLSGSSGDWSEYYKDEAIRHEIDKDVRRTYSAFHFFQERVKPIVMTLEEARAQAKAEAAQREADKSLFDNGGTRTRQTANTNSPNDTDPSDDVSRAPPRKEDETHQDVIRRILFIYAKLNPGVRYVQGMNEILAPIYYVFAHDSSELFADHAEPDAFFCFTSVMSDIRDRFIKSLDNSPSGVLAVVKLINTYLRELDPELWSHLEDLKVDPRFYSFRWITLLLSQEFELPEVMRLWDSLFADQNRFEFLLYCCCSMLVCVRGKLLKGEFADALRTLQHYPENGVEFLAILSTATRLKRNLEARRRGQTLDNPVVPEHSYQAFIHSANAAGLPKQPNAQATTSTTSHQHSNSQSNNQFQAQASATLAQVSASAAAVSGAAQAQAQQFMKSVSSFFKK